MNDEIRARALSWLVRTQVVKETSTHPSTYGLSTRIVGCYQVEGVSAALPPQDVYLQTHHSACGLSYNSCFLLAARNSNLGGRMLPCFRCLSCLLYRYLVILTCLFSSYATFQTSRINMGSPQSTLGRRVRSQLSTAGLPQRIASAPRPRKD